MEAHLIQTQKGCSGDHVEDLVNGSNSESKPKSHGHREASSQQGRDVQKPQVAMET